MCLGFCLCAYGCMSQRFRLYLLCSPIRYALPILFCRCLAFRQHTHRHSTLMAMSVGLAVATERKYGQTTFTINLCFSFLFFRSQIQCAAAEQKKTTEIETQHRNIKCVLPHSYTEPQLCVIRYVALFVCVLYLRSIHLLIFTVLPGYEINQ